MGSWISLGRCWSVFYYVGGFGFRQLCFHFDRYIRERLDRAIADLKWRRSLEYSVLNVYQGRYYAW